MPDNPPRFRVSHSPSPAVGTPKPKGFLRRIAERLGWKHEPARSVLVHQKRSVWHQFKAWVAAIRTRFSHPQKSVFFRQRKTIAPPPRIFRLLRVNVWRTKRKFLRWHARTNPLLVTGVYLALTAAAVLALSTPLWRTSRKPPSITRANLPPQNAAALLTEAAALLKDQQTDDALARVREAQDLAGPNARACQIEGAILAARKEYPAALQAFQNALKLRPGSPTIRFNIAELAFVTGNYAQAEKTYRALRKTWTTNKLLIFRIYLCCLMQGHPKEAASLAASDQIDPQSLEWFYIHAVAAFQAGKRADASKLIQSAQVLYGTSTQPYDRTLDRLKLN